MKIITVDKNKCTYCYACLRACPTKAISINKKNGEIQVNNNWCIACGNCYTNCGPGAISYLSSINSVLEILEKNEQTVAIVDPSIASEFPDILDYRNFVGMIRALGFSFVNEISFGADLVAIKYKQILENFKGKYYIGSNCPPVYDYIEKFQPHIVESLIPIVSPLIATAKVVRKLHGDQIKIVGISPCLAQKKEIKRYGNLVNEVISFEELRELFKIKNIYENSVEFSEFDPPIGSLGSLFPLSRGILDAAKIDHTPGKLIVTREGQESFKRDVDDFANYAEIKHHLNIFYCQGCAMGPCTTNRKSYLTNHSLIVKYTNKRSSLIDYKIWEEEIRKYSDIELEADFNANDQRIPEPPETKIIEVLKLLNKENYSEIGCKSCGYDNCYEFARDVARDLVIPDMCVTFTLKNRQDFIEKLTSANQKLAETQKALEESEAKLRKEHEDAKEAISMIKAILEKIPSSVVIIDDKYKIIQSNQKFIDLIGQEAAEINEIIPGLVGADIKSLLDPQIFNFFSFVVNKNENLENKDVEINNKFVTLSVFPIKKGKIIGAVFKNLSQPEVRKEEIIARINDVIEKNLKMVQQIGFLLGEGASETEKMLNSIIKSFEKDSGKRNE